MTSYGLFPSTGNCYSHVNFSAMRKLKNYSLIFFLILSAPIVAQVNVTRVSADAVPQTKDGIFYALPRTVLEVEMAVDRVENYKGPYAEFAGRLLGLKNIVEANSVEYHIRSISVTTSQEPDPEQYYFVEIGGKAGKGETLPLLHLTEAGIILGIHPGQAQQTVVAGRLPQGSDDDAARQNAFGELFKYSADISIVEKVDTIIRKINIDTMTVEKQYYKRTLVEKSPEQKAREAADFIGKIKESRFNLISGTQEVNYNKETLEYMDEQLTRMEKEYLKLFTGVSVTRKQTYRFKYIPVPSQINTEIPVFKFQKSKGITDLDEPGGKFITVRVSRVGNTHAVASFLGKAEEKQEFLGLAYRIPELAKITVKVDEENQTETQCMVSQLGVITRLPSGKWNVQFHETTGGIKSAGVQ